MSTDIFNAIAPRYDLVNYVLSFGMDIGWRKKVVRYLPPGNGLKVLDLATGTGDVAVALAREALVSEVVGIDLADEMLKLAQAKVARAGLQKKVRLSHGNAQDLEFADSSFDALTVAFGVRNFSDLMKGLMEARRVLKAGGSLIVLEFSSPDSLWQRPVHAFYLKFILPFVGMLFTGKIEAYNYLSRTVRAFPYGDRFSRIIRQVGFRKVERVVLAMGAATIYVAHK